MTMRSFPIVIIAVIIAACVSLTPLGVVAQDAEKASPEKSAEFLKKLGQDTFAVLRDNSTSLEEREATVRRILASNFDFEKIGRFVLGRSWRKATTAQRDEYLNLFEEFVLRIYARRIGGYKGQTFRVIKSQPAGKRDALITTEISRPTGGPLIAGWRVRSTNGELKVLDVIVQGISMISTQRSEFAALIKKEKIEGLLVMLRAKVSKIPAQES